MKKKKRRRSMKRTSTRYKDTHHIFWCRKDYQVGWKKRLRDHWYCRVEIPMNTLHHKLHQEIPQVPTPNVQNIKDALFQLNMLEKYNAIHPYDTIEKRLIVLMALFECCEPETYAALKAQYEIVRKHFSRSPR